MSHQHSPVHFYIVTPSFNQAQFLEETIQSILNQQGNHTLHYCVMDGGSTDGTTKLLETFGARFTWESKKDKGQTDAINKGIRFLKQEWEQAVQIDESAQHIFAYLNSDDYYLPDAFSVVAQTFTQNPSEQWLVGDAVIVNEGGSEIQKPVRFYKQLWRALYHRQVLSILNPIPQPATFIRMNALEQVGEFSETLQYVMDYEYWQRLQQHFGNPMIIPDALAAFRIHGNSKGGSQFELQFAEELAISKQYASGTWAPRIHQWHNKLITTVYSVIK